MRVTFHPEAWDDYADATRRYLRIRRELGESFVGEVERALTAIADHPTGWPMVDAGARRYNVHRFPYGVYYTEVEDGLLIVAVMHHSRRPRYWRNRLPSA